MIIQELFLEGARLSEEVLNVKIDGHEPEICDMIDHWVKTQWSVYETAYISDTIWQEIKTVKDLENTDLINRFNGAAWEFKPANDLYWQAARSGEFSRILDVYAANDQAFPFEKLYVEKTEDGICLLDLINFNGEPDIHAKILDPELWQGQTDQLSDFWHNHLPEAIKAAHPFEGLTQKIYGVTAKDHYKIKKRQPLKR